ncbi:hypothetical protein CC2G_013667 [Coprinopsis cinerea AmutBmut pab1-1]|nr:hypothetical protein CC2G_013667 [Coprinopsis cinerea AmutBmut pab1-1]
MIPSRIARNTPTQELWGRTKPMPGFKPRSDSATMLMTFGALTVATGLAYYWGWVAEGRRETKKAHLESTEAENDAEGLMLANFTPY